MTDGPPYPRRFDPRLLPPQRHPIRLWEPDSEQPLRGGLQSNGHGFPPRAGEEFPPRNAWERLTRGQPLGKRAVMIYDASLDVEQTAGVPFFQLSGNDCDAQQLTLVLAPPTVVAEPFTDVRANDVNIQNLSTSQDNYEVSDADFPGALVPITWPPLQAKIKWGIGGHHTEAWVDIMNGCVVNLCASFVEVLAAIVLTDDNAISGTSAAYSLAAFIGPGFTRPGNAQNTVYVGSLEESAESLVFPVPRFAKRAYVIGRDPAVTPAVTVATLRFWQNVLPAGNAGARNVGNFLCTSNQFQPVDVPNGGQYFSVLSGEGQTNSYAVIFDLSL